MVDLERVQAMPLSADPPAREVIEPEDDALMLAYGDGDMAAFDTLYGRYRAPMWRFFVRQADPATASECQQEVWLRVVQQAPRYRARGRFRSWLFAIVHNVLVDRQRRDTVRLVEPLTEDQPESVTQNPGPAERAEQGQLAGALLALIAALPLVQREALLLREEANLTLAEIAQATDTSAETAKSRLRYAMQKLRAGMNEHV